MSRPRGRPFTSETARIAGRKGAAARKEKRRLQRLAREQFVAALPGDVPPRLETTADVRTWASWVTQRVARGEVDRATARVILAGLREMGRAIDLDELRKRVEVLRREVRELKRRREL